MSTLTVCTFKPYKCDGVEVLWVSGTNRYHVRDESGDIGKRDGYSTVDAAMRAAARIATDRYIEKMES